MNNNEWQCEGCEGINTGEPAAIEKHPGYCNSTVELWFCEDCVMVTFNE